MAKVDYLWPMILRQELFTAFLPQPPSVVVIDVSYYLWHVLAF